MRIDPDLPPGYRRDPDTGAWLTLPWPDDLAELPPSLGFQVIDWAHEHLIHHLSGRPWEFTMAQKRFLVLWYAVDDHDRWLYRSGTFRRSKGSGKTPCAAAMCLAELMGPVKFAHFDTATGRPIGVPHLMSLVAIAANSEAQAQEVLFVANAMVPNATRREYGFEPGKLGSSAGNGGRLKLMTNSVKTAEGAPVTFVAYDESHHALESNGGRDLASVIRRNLGKSPDGSARVVEYTNAHEEGGGSVAEDTYLAWQAQMAGRTKNVDILYDSREAAPSLSLSSPADIDQIVVQAYAEAPWISTERIQSEIDDIRVSVSDSIRYYANGLAAAESSWVEPRNFDACARPDVIVADHEEIALALDCSKSGDATTLSAARISDGHVLSLGIWQRPHGDRGRGWLAPREEVDLTVRQLFSRYSVVWFGVDPSPATDDETEHSYWQPMLDQWHRDYHSQLLVWASSGHSVSFDMRFSAPGGREKLRLFTEAAMETAEAIDEDASLTHDGDPALRLHVQHARRRPNSFGVGFGKSTRDSGNKVDYAVTMVLARMGRRAYLNSAKHAKKQPRRGVWTM